MRRALRWTTAAALMAAGVANSVDKAPAYSGNEWSAPGGDWAMTRYSTLDQITRERFLELAFEGHYLPEAKRLQKNVGVNPWNSPKLILPIPQRELDVNKQLIQNEGY